MYTQYSGWVLFILGILASIWTLNKAMRGYDTENTKPYIPRLFLASYLAFTFSYILQILEKYLEPKDPRSQQGEIMVVWMITLVLICLPWYNAHVRMLFRYSCGPSKIPGCGYDSDAEGEERLEDGKFGEEMRRELRSVVRVEMYHRKR
ncbi:hypothetical protein I302_107032 [Kwoniella bestiolae CBS 10118]|uniref:Uncharacterized protein n=1 Tax=Kwoniella bestiolae CBS 10118 TaxID=1296100 RepID=A0A1B9FZP5_9TREE|nr:hypothetical protein I302_05703 [Kwoniella bestiolae CBS 10118]OCF24244.1 hypothetical protein I302_05703 [Kwoniella bestiolae CBS 10118]